MFELNRLDFQHILTMYLVCIVRSRFSVRIQTTKRFELVCGYAIERGIKLSAFIWKLKSSVNVFLFFHFAMQMIILRWGLINTNFWLQVPSLKISSFVSVIDSYCLVKKIPSKVDLVHDNISKYPSTSYYLHLNQGFLTRRYTYPLEVWEPNIGGIGLDFWVLVVQAEPIFFLINLGLAWDLIGSICMDGTFAMIGKKIWIHCYGRLSEGFHCGGVCRSGQGHLR